MGDIRLKGDAGGTGCGRSGCRGEGGMGSRGGRRDSERKGWRIGEIERKGWGEGQIARRDEERDR